ncbi:NTPase [Enterococcus innesii]|uniref:NTPase n=1 Tax=Enterococcus innesii TaxID=2839759 RepID=A0ABM7XRA1_9ENTE|nr:P-loop NTPase fold protein [Enterococcus innesii]BDG67573.1 NTPase [Enterococcus innesii]
MTKYHSDQPINDRKKDEYNRSVFVDDFIKILTDFEDKENYIIGLYAKWGRGKTSTVNMILDSLKNKEQFCEIYLSAWALGGDYEKILWDILDQASRKIMKKKAKNKRARFGGFLSKVSKAEIPFDLDTELDLNSGGRKETKISSGKIINTVNYVGQMLASSDNIDKARKRIEESIGDKKVIVFIDDLDRLEGKQIIDILRAINTVADYGGMTYILPFDKRYVCSAIEECLPKDQNGDEFIEKLIQVPIALPELTQERLDKVLLGKIDKLFNEFGITLTEEEVNRFQRLYFYGANKYIASPRDINKIINVYRFRVPISIGEINVVDLSILEIVRTFDEPLYQLIRTNRELFVKQTRNISPKYLLDSDNEKRKADADKLLSNIPDEKLEIVQGLFPIIDEIYNNHFTTDGERLRRQQRIASEFYFDLFFASLDEEEGISNREIIKILQLTDLTELKNEVFSKINKNNFDIALKMIVDNIDLISNSRDFCKVLLDLVETFPQKNVSIGFKLSLLETLIFRIDDILEKSNTKLEDYISLLDQSYCENRMETFVLLLKNVYVYSQKGKNRKEIDLNEEEIGLYKEHALELIRQFAKENKIPVNVTDSSNRIYMYWKELGNKSEISEYIQNLVKTADQALDFISQFLGKATALGKSDYRRTDMDRSTYELIGELIDPNYFYELLKENEKYSSLINIEKENVVSLEDRYDSNGEEDEFSRVGNEHNDEFRVTVASQFIYIHEHSVKDSVVNND